MQKVISPNEKSPQLKEIFIEEISNLLGEHELHMTTEKPTISTKQQFFYSNL